mgnify:CR=1 FL=1
MRPCMICQDKKRFNAKEYELQSFRRGLERLLRPYGSTPCKKEALSDRTLRQLLQVESLQPRLKCGTCPHLNQGRFNRQEAELKGLLRQFIVIADDLSPADRQQLYRQLLPLLSGRYPRLYGYLDRVMRTMMMNK